MYTLVLDSQSKKCKAPFVCKNGVTGTVFSTRNKNATPELTLSGKAVVHGKDYSCFVNPSMEALFLLWFAKYLLYLAAKDCQEELGSNTSLIAIKNGGKWPVTAWSDKGSKNTYSEEDYKFFFSSRKKIHSCASADKEKDSSERFMHFDYPEATMDVGGLSPSSTASTMNSSTILSDEDAADEEVQPISLGD